MGWINSLALWMDKKTNQKAMKVYEIANKSDGNVLMDEESKVIAELRPGAYIVSYQLITPMSDIKDYRRAYFAKIDTLANEIGYTRYEMHELVKEHVLDSIVGTNSSEPQKEYILSTKSLDPTGWKVFLQQLDEWAFINHSIILP